MRARLCVCNCLQAFFCLWRDERWPDSHQHVARNVSGAHVCDELQRTPQLLPGPAQRDHGGVGVAVAQPLQDMVQGQQPHPVEELPCPVTHNRCDELPNLACIHSLTSVNRFWHTSAIFLTICLMLALDLLTTFNGTGTAGGTSR